MVSIVQTKGRSKTPKKFYSILSWKTLNQQNKKAQHENLVAPAPSPMTPIIFDGNASIKPKHLSFLGGTGKIRTAT